MAAYQRRKGQYSGVKKDAPKRFKELQEENARLNRLVAGRALDMAISKEGWGGKMVGRARNRGVVAHVCQRLKASERRACRALGQARSGQRYKATPREDDARLTDSIQRAALRESRAGSCGGGR